MDLLPLEKKKKGPCLPTFIATNSWDLSVPRAVSLDFSFASTMFRSRGATEKQGKQLASWGIHETQRVSQDEPKAPGPEGGGLSRRGWGGGDGPALGPLISPCFLSQRWVSLRKRGRGLSEISRCGSVAWDFEGV